MPEAWPETAAELEALQAAISARATEVITWDPPARPLAVAAVFASTYRGLVGLGEQGDPVWAAAVLMREGRLIEKTVLRGSAGAAYAPGLLALRDGPLLEESVRRLGGTPDVVLVNATGRDHPRRAGLALHMGAVLGLPTIGVTDRPLLAAGPQPGPERGATAPLILEDELVGFWLRSQPAVRPIVVHAGWRTAPETAARVALAEARRSRTPEPIRQARLLARTSRAIDQT